MVDFWLAASLGLFPQIEIIVVTVNHSKHGECDWSLSSLYVGHKLQQTELLKKIQISDLEVKSL